MSVFYSSFFTSTHFAESDSPQFHLWSNDASLSSRLLFSIAREATHRGLPLQMLRDPLLPNRLCGLSISGIGSFTTRPNDLTPSARLIDCTDLSIVSSCDPIALHSAALQKKTLFCQIRELGNTLQSQLALCNELSAPIVQSDSLSHRAKGIAQKCKRTDGKRETLPILGYSNGEEVFAFPFEKEVQIICVQGAYRLPTLFLHTLEDALSQRCAERVILENSLTHDWLGIWIPQQKLCYLSNAPDEISSSKLMLNRYLAPHTQSCRHSLRSLLSACRIWEERLLSLLGEYQALSAREEALCASLYENNRLQEFCKRLFIDLFD